MIKNPNDKKHCYDYPRPMVTVDMVVLRNIENEAQILLIERGKDPFKNSWALPGGFIEMEEELVDSAYRELQEETSIVNIELRALNTYGKPGRDPRGRTISVVFGGILKSQDEAIAGDDAAKADWFSIHQLPELAFDHALIVKESLALLLV